MIDGEGALGVIAGTGFYALDSLRDARNERIETEYGPAQATEGSLAGRPTYFVSRHGIDHSVPPHMVNYRAIIQALYEAGVSQVLAINVVGGIGHEAGDLVVVDDFIDFTRQRPLTFFDGSTPEGVVHVDVSQPYSPKLREAWIGSARRLGVPVSPHGVYGAFEGPRFETRSEIRMAAAAGVTVVGMTGVPEVVLAAERGIPYASLCLVANPAAGLSSVPITVAEVEEVVRQGAATVVRVLEGAASILAGDA